MRQREEPRREEEEEEEEEGGRTWSGSQCASPASASEVPSPYLPTPPIGYPAPICLRPDRVPGAYPPRRPTGLYLRMRPICVHAPDRSTWSLYMPRGPIGARGPNLPMRRWAYRARICRRAR
eukprot:3009821-Rhodomonas_salina.1